MLASTPSWKPTGRDGSAKWSNPKAREPANPGIFGGKDGKAAGDATNVVTDYVTIKGEARSADEKFTAAIVADIGTPLRRQRLW